MEAAAQRMGYDFSGVDAPENERDFYSLHCGMFVEPLVKALQEQQQMTEDQRLVIEGQHALLQQLTERLEVLENR